MKKSLNDVGTFTSGLVPRSFTIVIDRLQSLLFKLTTLKIIISKF